MDIGSTTYQQPPFATYQNARGTRSKDAVPAEVQSTVSAFRTALEVQEQSIQTLLQALPPPATRAAEAAAPERIGQNIDISV